MPGQKAPTPRRYAQAIFQLALEKGQLTEWRRDLDVMVGFTENPSVLDLLESPGINPKDRLKVIKDTIPKISDLGVNFMALLAGQHGLGLLPRIRQSLTEMFDRTNEMSAKASGILTSVPAGLRACP